MKLIQTRMVCVAQLSVLPILRDTLSGCGIIFRLLSGGLRYATTTGYYLPALQAENPVASAPGSSTAGDAHFLCKAFRIIVTLELPM
jgi:hypothetical protein